MSGHEAQATLELTNSTSTTTPIVVIGALQIDLWKGHAYLSGSTLDLSKTEFCVLLYLAQHAGRPVSTAELLRAVWHCADPGGGSSNQVKSCVKRLWQKLELDVKHPQYLRTVYKGGYMIPTISPQHD